LIVNVFIVIFSFALMFTYYWKLALVILLVIPFYALIYFILNKFNKSRANHYGKRSRIANTIGRVLPIFVR
jgi:ABC-type multidrug transport system fused ATPase/permease subunit